MKTVGGPEQTLPQTPEGTDPEDALILDFQPPELWENPLLLFQASFSLWHFVKAATGH